MFRTYPPTQAETVLKSAVAFIDAVASDASDNFFLLMSSAQLCHLEELKACLRWIADTAESSSKNDVDFPAMTEALAALFRRQAAIYDDWGCVFLAHECREEAALLMEGIKQASPQMTPRISLALKDDEK